MIRSMSNQVRKFAVIVSVGLACAIAASAQQRAPRRSQAAPPTAQTRQTETPGTPLASDPDVQAADIAITADIKAESLVFEAVPNPRVEFPGSHALSTVWEAFRDNLPTPVQPGVTYRNIGIRLKITSVFTDIDRIVAEALGEIPVSQDARPADEKPSRTQNPQSPAPQSGSVPPPRER
jgi:hypothetical protein